MSTRRSKSPSPIAGDIAATARAIFKARGFQQDHILRHWPEIVGLSLAEMSKPEKLVFPKQSAGVGMRRAEGATLTVRVDGPAALEFTHQEPQILERINGYYGYRAVTRIKLLQAPLPLPPRPSKRRIAPLDPTEEAALRAEMADIQSDSLRTALETLGRRILGTKKAGRTGPRP